jgi:cytidylate kinase
MQDYSAFIKNASGAKIKVYAKRPKDLGLLIVIGGPGGSGASTIARLLASKFGLQYVYGGGIMRSIAKNKGYSTLEDFLASDIMKKQSSVIDREIDEKVLKSSFARNVLIDSKDFAAISTYRQIPSTVKIWLTADIDVRVHRMLWSMSMLPKGKIISKRSKVYKETSLKLMQRYSNDKNRYKKLYNIDYDNEEKYNDIVIDTSKMNASETFNLILKLIKEGGYIK